MALGASRGSLIRESLAETAFVLAAGLATGLVASIVAIRLIGRFISGLLFGLEAIDPLNLAGAALLMLAVAAAACVVPAHRVTRIDPLAAIRHE
jgi:putative ABC transport system permease protein